MSVDLFSSMFRLRHDGTVGTEEFSMRPDLDGWTAVAMRAEKTADLKSAANWMRHPDGDEVMCVLSGALRIYYRTGGEQDADGELRGRIGPGGAFVVPSDAWHRVELEEPTEMVVVLRAEGTVVEQRPGR
ncbi:cupin domain [Streptomyces sp. BK208]|uniref:cupin domain-containing protein n=1 Tax=Streptomyces sp. BK208 TaxID=2512150 RepID=UPI00105B78DD|nr:cupin domain-containing protein [Streptomyces sp. BK208]TDT42713.1 cupin domain [Streptomyces sp. BK208]